MKPENPLQTFRNLISCVHNIDFSEFDMDMNPGYSTAANPVNVFLMLSIDALNTLDEMGTLGQRLLSSSNNNDSSYRGPVTGTNSLGMMWVSEIEMADERPFKIHVMGPVFTDDFSLDLIRNRMDKLQISVSMKQQFLSFIEALPVIPIMQMTEYGIMQHYALTGERLQIHDMQRDLKIPPLPFLPENDAAEPPDHPHGTYTAEKKLLDMVREGNIHYKEQLNQLAFTGKVGKMSNGDLMRQAKNTIVSFTTLCSRAAIEGGLSPQTAFLLSDRYIQQAEEATRLSQLTEISHSMLETYIYQVHRIKSSQISPQIQQVCSQLHLHPEEKLDIHALADSFGYSDYYFTRKFKQETGVSIKEYLLQQKIELAKHLLIDTTLSIAQISDRLNICSQSYFGDLFRKRTGLSPLEFREKGCL